MPKHEFLILGFICLILGFILILLGALPYLHAAFPFYLDVLRPLTQQALYWGVIVLILGVFLLWYSNK